MNINILIVEYDIKTIDEIKAAFPYSSFNFKIAEDGLKAKEVLETENFDLVITAAMLPKFHGFQLSQFLSEKYSDIKIIIISGIYKGVDYRHQALTQFKADDFFEKPLDIELLKKRVIELLDLDIDELSRSNSIKDKKALTDTAKVPIYQKQKEEDKKLTSDDIFGDIIKDVEKSASGNEILSKEIPTPPKNKKIAVKPINSFHTTKLDLNEFSNLIKKPENKKVVKRIEDDISKKLEDTLSGLGLSANPKRKPMVTKITSTKPQTEIKEKSNSEEKYDIIGLIARGGMAEIYKAKKKGVKGFKKVIAIKKILTGYGEDDKFIEMFVDEAKIAAELTHPNIVQIYDFEKRDDTYLIAMEFVQGKDLRNILRYIIDEDKKIPEELSLYIISMILEALSYAHSAKDDIGTSLNIVHRDVSPPNILISYNGEVKLTDFGVSKASNKMHQTISGALKGKLLYMAPEQARGEKNIDSKADLYSVGVILFELLTGRKLFIDNSEMAILKKVQEGTIVKPSEVYKDIDPELERITLKALSKSLKIRYQSANEMIADISKYISATYNKIPGSVHLSHYIYSLFKNEIVKDNIQVDLKPVPDSIEKIKKEVEIPIKTPSEIALETQPSPHTEVIDLGNSIDQPDLFEEKTEDISEDSNIIENSTDEIAGLNDYAPAIDISLSANEQEPEEPESKKPTTTLEEIEQHLKDQNKIVPDIFNTEEKSKKPLLIAAIIIIILSAIVYFAISSGVFSGKDKLPKGPIIILPNETELIKDLVYEKGEDTPLTGFVENKWQNMNIKENTEYKNGLKNGTSKEYYKNNILKQEGHFFNGKKNNLWTTYNEKGKKVSQINYKDGKKNGQTIKWNSLNNIVAKKTFKNGIELSKITFVYHPQSKLIKEETFFKNGLETQKKVWDIKGNRLIRGILTNRFRQNKLNVGKRTYISFEISNPEFQNLPTGTSGAVIGIDSPDILFTVEVSDSDKNNSRVTNINNKKRSVLIEKDKVFIEFILSKKQIEEIAKAKYNKENGIETKEELLKKEEEKKLKDEADKKLKADLEKKKKEEEKLAEEQKAEEERLRLAEEEKKKLEEAENQRIEQAKLAKQEEERKKRDALKVGDLVIDVDVKPVPIATPSPELSKKIKKKIQSDFVQVIARILINEKGSVARIKMIKNSGIPEVDNAIIFWVDKNWKFKPATKYNKKVKTWITKVIKINK